MATTVLFPSLNALGRRAKTIGASKSRLLVRAVEQAVQGKATWTPEFLARLRDADAETSSAFDELLTHVRVARQSKKPQKPKRS